MTASYLTIYPFFIFLPVNKLLPKQGVVIQIMKQIDGKHVYTCPEMSALQTLLEQRFPEPVL